MEKGFIRIVSIGNGQTHIKKGHVKEVRESSFEEIFGAISQKDPTRKDPSKLIIDEDTWARLEKMKKEDKGIPVEELGYAPKGDVTKLVAQKKAVEAELDSKSKENETLKAELEKAREAQAKLDELLKQQKETTKVNAPTPAPQKKAVEAEKPATTTKAKGK